MPASTQTIAHWKSALGGMPALVELPVDHPRTPNASSARASIPSRVSAVLANDLASLAGKHGVDRTTVLLTTWIALLHRLSVQTDLVVGVTAGKIARLPLRLEVTPSASTAAWIGQVAKLWRAASAEADISDAELASIAGVALDGDGHAAWQLGFNTAAREVAMHVTDEGDVLSLRLEYDTALLEEGTIRRWLEYWQNLVQAMVADDDRPVDRIAIMDAAERRRVLEEPNATQVDYPRDVCLHVLIEQQVARTPDAIAVVADDRALTFAELNARANQLAHHLRSLGVRPDDRVGICVERGWQMVVGLVAIIKSGGAYVPLDPEYPSDRLAHMLKDSAPKVLLSQAKLESTLRVVEITCPILDISSATPPWSDQPTSNIPVTEIGLTARNLAYMIYTSGSTGLPKGAMNEHRGIVNRLLWMQDEYKIGAKDTVLQKTPFSFDVSVWEFFWGLLVGARLVMAKPGGHKDPEYLTDTIVKHGVTTMHFVPSMLHAFLEYDGASRATGVLKKVMCSGEALPLASVQRFHERLPGVELHNLYGPTEAAVDVTYWPCLPGATGLSIPIGRPVANTRMYVLDAHREPVPMGVTGELYIGGIQVGRGYLNRDELTAERFIKDPFVDDADARMYKTGDLGRWMPNGAIEYLGRNDFQVKIRGFRIELGEIEARLVEHPRVSAGVVLAKPDGAGDLRLVAYYVPEEGGAAISVEEFRKHLGANLPDHMIPAVYVRLDALPVTPNGKLDRRALPEPDNARPELAAAYEPPRDDDEKAVCDAFSAVLDISEVGRNDNFFDLGGNSLLAMRLLERVRQVFAERRGADNVAALTATTFFRHPTPAALTTMLSGKAAGLDATRMGKARSAASRNEPIAIIAMAARVPGADDVETFWQNLKGGKDTITKFDRSELDPSIPAAERNDPSYVPARGIIEGLELFDAGFFGISPREAELMDPQQRIFLELSWECLERGGYAPDAMTVPVGVFAGMNNGTYFQNHVSRRPDLIEKLGAFQVMVNNEKDYVATRVAHKLNLTGPALSTHTACSTSLVTICQAVDSLRLGQCDMALAGAASATCPPKSGYRYIEGAMLSPDGHTRTFDKDSGGTVFSDGAAVVLLKRLEDALADGDDVIAVIKGAAINNDGGQKASFTAPSAEGQAAVIAMAHADAGIDPRTISYVEAHGTATPLGDPIEIEGLTQAFRVHTQDKGFCRIGSVKSNVGHLVIAAGAAGVIKTALAMREERIPETVHFKTPNPTIDFASSPFVITPGASEWKRTEGAPRRAGVSSFGVGGTNAHVVMEEAPPQASSDPAKGPQILVLSARSPGALAKMAKALGEHLEANPSINLADVAMTLDVGRKRFPHRFAIAAESAASAAATLQSSDTAAAIARTKPAHTSEVVFMFPGQGSQYAGMGRELYATEPHFREAFDECAEGLKGELGFDLRDVVFKGDAEALLPTSVMQPAIFSIEYSLARLWMSYGVMPAAMMGHSIGEFAAAALAGIFSLPDALKLVARRGRLMQERPAGSMLSVRMTLADLTPRVPAELSIAAENSPTACVVSGPTPEVEKLQAVLEKEGIACRMLFTSHAFHSSMMDPVVDAFRAEVAAVKRSAPQMRVLSTANAAFLDEATATSPDYWASHLRQPVRFSAAVLASLELPARVLLEVGSRTTLSALSRQHPQLAKAQKTALPSLSDNPESEVKDFRHAAGQLWASGVSIDLSLFDDRKIRRRVRLPTYAFERQRHWVEASAAEPMKIVSTVKAAATNGANGTNGAHKPAPVASAAPGDRRASLLARLRALFDDAAGIPIDDPTMNFIEVGLDSLMLTQIALRLARTFGVKVTFRQLMSDCSSLDKLVTFLEPHVPAEEAPLAAIAETVTTTFAEAPAVASAASPDILQRVLDLQLQMAAQLQALLAGGVGHAGGGAARALLDQAQTTKALAASAAPLPAPPKRVVTHGRLMDVASPPRPGARLGRAPNGEPAWYVPDPKQPGKFLKVTG